MTAFHNSHHHISLTESQLCMPGSLLWGWRRASGRPGAPPSRRMRINSVFPTTASHKVSVVRRGVYKKGAIRRRIGDGDKKLTAEYHPRLNLAPWQNLDHLNIKKYGGSGNIFLVFFQTWNLFLVFFQKWTLHSPLFLSDPKTTVTASPSIWAEGKH